jgi:hypothetical protein
MLRARHLICRRCHEPLSPLYHLYPCARQVDLQLARLVAGLGGPRARAQVSALVSSMVEAGHGLAHPADRLAVVIEASQASRRCAHGTVPDAPPAGHL